MTKNLLPGKTLVNQRTAGTFSRFSHGIDTIFTRKKCLASPTNFTYSRDISDAQNDDGLSPKDGQKKSYRQFIAEKKNLYQQELIQASKEALLGWRSLVGVPLLDEPLVHGGGADGG